MSWQPEKNPAVRGGWGLGYLLGNCLVIFLEQHLPTFQLNQPRVSETLSPTEIMDKLGELGRQGREERTLTPRLLPTTIWVIS